MKPIPPTDTSMTFQVRRDTLSEVERDEAEAISLFVNLLAKVRETSNADLLDDISEALNEWQMRSRGGMVTERYAVRQPRNFETSHSGILTMHEVAQLLRCSKAHLCNVLNGKVPSLPPLPCVSLGRRKLIRRAALEKWLEQLERTEVQG